MRKIFFPAIRLDNELRRAGYNTSSQNEYGLLGFCLEKTYITDNQGRDCGEFARDHLLQWYPRIRTNSAEVAAIAQSYSVNRSRLVLVKN